jgi:capsular exopolysaccharide synthesis family protein
MSGAQVKAIVAQRLGQKAPPVSVSPAGETDVIDIAATSTVPRQASSIANAYANAYVDFRRSQGVDAATASARDVQAKISSVDGLTAALNAQIAAASPDQRSVVQQNLAPQVDALANQEAALRTQLGQLQLNSGIQTGVAQVLTPAAVPTSPSSPRLLRNALVAAAIGLVLGIGLGFLRDYLDDSIRTKEELERAGGGLPVLGLIPAVSGRKTKSGRGVISLAEPASPAGEAYRSLRTSLQLLALDSPAWRLQVTSPSAEEGKTTTVANLGVALAAAGERVVMVCCDLRRPRLHEFFGLSNEIGFTSVLLGRVSVEEACQAVPQQEGLSLLAAGPPATNSSEVLQSKKTTELLQRLQAGADVLLIDCPPVVPVADAAVVSASVDATLLVTSANESHAKTVARALEVLGQVGAPVVGTVLNKVSEKSAYGSTYNYRYYRTDPEHVDANGSLGNGRGASSRQTAESANGRAIDYDAAQWLP